MVRGRHPYFKYNPFFILTGVFTLGIVLYLTLPLFVLFFRTTPELLYTSLLSPMMRNSLRLSLITTCITTVLIVLIGTPAAYVQSRGDYPGKRVVDTCVDLPIVLPPAVAGFALLLMYGRMGLLGHHLYAYGIKIPFTMTAVVMAQLFVAAPLYIRHAESVFSQLNKNYEEAAQTLGAGPFRTFRTITLPLTYIGLLSGATTAYARALGEFGATIMFAGNLPGVTQTMPLAIYTSMQSDLNSAVTLSILLIISSLLIMLAVRYISGKEEKNAYM